MTLPHSTPSAQGVDAAGLLSFLTAVREHDLGLHGLVVARHGHVIAEGWVRPYAADRAQLVYSLSKTLTATAVGLLVQEGRLGLDDLVVDHVPDLDRSSLDPHWLEVRVRHCLSMTVGHETDAWARSSTGPTSRPSTGTTTGWPASSRPGPLPSRARSSPTTRSRPTCCRSSSPGSAGECARCSGPRVLDPLGIGEVLWHTDPQGRELGFSGAHLRTGDVLALAQLYLDRGVWRGERILDEAWVAEATVAFGPLNEDPGAGADWRRGYGYSFWMQQVGFRGDGAYGQFLIVLPEHDVAIAITSEHERMQTMLDLLWEHVVPHDRRAGVGGRRRVPRTRSRRARPRAAGRGRARPDAVELRRSASSTVSASYAGVSVARDGAAHVVSLHRGESRLPIRVGAGEWVASVLQAEGWSLPVVASGGWVDEDTFRAEVRVIETPHSFRIEGRLRERRGRTSSGGWSRSWAVTPSASRLAGADPLDPGPFSRGPRR